MFKAHINVQKRNICFDVQRGCKMETKSSYQMFCERIEILRNGKHEKIKDFAERCGVTPNQLSNLKTRGKCVPYDLLEKIANACNVSMDWLVGRTDVREVAYENRVSDNCPDYLGLEYGYIFNILSFLAALNCLQIVQTKDGVVLRVHDEHIARFLRTLQNLARMSASDQSVYDAFRAWAEKVFTDEELAALNNNFFIGRYHGALPWEHDVSFFLNFDFSGVKWGDALPDTWENYYVNKNGETCAAPYSDYAILNDGIVGCYDSDVPHPEPPTLVKCAQREQGTADDSVTNP